MNEVVFVIVLFHHDSVCSSAYSINPLPHRDVFNMFANGADPDQVILCLIIET